MSGKNLLEQVTPGAPRCEQPRCTKKRVGFFAEPGTGVLWAGCKRHLAVWLLEEVNGADISRGVVRRAETVVRIETHEGLPVYARKSTKGEPSEELGDCRVCGRRRADGPTLGYCDDAGDLTCLRLGYTREHERAQALADEAAPLVEKLAKAEQDLRFIRSCNGNCDDECIECLEALADFRTEERDTAESRVTELEKQLGEARDTIEGLRTVKRIEAEVAASLAHLRPR